MFFPYSSSYLLSPQDPAQHLYIISEEWLALAKKGCDFLWWVFFRVEVKEAIISVNLNKIYCFGIDFKDMTSFNLQTALRDVAYQLGKNQMLIKEAGEEAGSGQ